jgi:hypothetical protein
MHIFVFWSHNLFYSYFFHIQWSYSNFYKLNFYEIGFDWLIDWCLTSSEQFFSYIQDKNI